MTFTKRTMTNCYWILVGSILLVSGGYASRNCSFPPNTIAAIIHKSELIFTGKIQILVENVLDRTDIIPNYFEYNLTSNRRRSPRQLRAIVGIKVIFKGSKSMKIELEGKSIEVIVSIDRPEVKGQCMPRRLRVHDTRIFFLRYWTDTEELLESILKRDGFRAEDWEETLMPLPPMLHILTTVRQAVKDEPCADKECPFGGYCVVESGEGHCRCPTTCPSTSSIICGTDNVTYLNDCFLRQYTCQFQTVVKVKHTGDCKNQCADMICRYGSECVLSSNGHTASCQCPKRCTPSKQSANLLCGSDGKEYKSDCELEEYGCQNGKNLSVKYVGPCDPCQEITCPGNEICGLNEYRQPVCRCGQRCLIEFDPVCGSNGRTYRSECEMKEESCRMRQDLRIIYRGTCSSGVNLCDSLNCFGYEECLINQFGVAHCSCPGYCEPHVRPVCGSDGITYDSECELKVAACRKRSNTVVNFFGSCELCDLIECEYGAKCNAGICVCPQDCAKDVNPICGSNFKTYANDCELRKEACLKKIFISTQYHGECFAKPLDVPNSNLECECNRLGSFGETCNPLTQACDCRPGVGGVHCDRCLAGYWGLHMIIKSDEQGCQPCDCSKTGSIRSDCEQMTGECECFPGVFGKRCSECREGQVLGLTGCEMQPTESDISSEPSDEAGVDSKSKYPRHLQIHSLGYRPIPVTFFIGQSYLGDSCDISTDCVTPKTSCEFGKCECSAGFVEDVDRTQCKLLDQAVTTSTSQCNQAACDLHSNCFGSQNFSSNCLCPLGQRRISSSCGTNESPIPFFNGNSWIRLADFAGHHKFSLEFEIRPLQHSGIILYCSEYPNGAGDFLALTLTDGQIEFRYDHGYGAAILKSLTVLPLDIFSVVRANRYNRDGLLQINLKDEHHDSSPGPKKSLNLNHGCYFGSIPRNMSTEIISRIGVSDGFAGCIKNLRIGRRLIEFEDRGDPLILSHHLLFQCPTSPITQAHQSRQVSTEIVQNIRANDSNLRACSSSPCGPHSFCWSDDFLGFKCICHPTYTGKLCEVKRRYLPKVNDLSIDFNGNSYLELDQITTASREFSVELWFITREAHGLLLYSGQEQGRGDFISLYIQNYLIIFAYDLGSGIANITWSEPLEIGKWYWIIAHREGRIGRLQVNGRFPILGKSPPRLSELNLELPLFLGGVPDENLLRREISYPPSFSGIIQYINVNRETFESGILTGVGEGHVILYQGPPCGHPSPCQNGGTCFPRLDSFHCHCTAEFSGAKCDIGFQVPGPIRFDGQTFLQFPRKLTQRLKVQRRNEIEILFKTTMTTSATILWIGNLPPTPKSKRGGYLGLFLVEGYPELRLDLGTVKNSKSSVEIRSRIRVNDGRWHEVIIVRRRRQVVLQVDGKSPQRTTTSPGRNILVSDGKIWIGGIKMGLNSYFGIPVEFYGGFNGCIDKVRLEKRRLPLSKMALSNGISSCVEEDD